jgi:hypothetical protein
MQSYGVYTREDDVQVWTLENVTNYSMAMLAEEANAPLGVQTLIVGPATVFARFLEA